jgi:ferredoxin
MSSPLETARLRLVVDPIACDGRGLCAELLPEWIALDDWGFPIISDHPETSITESLARRAITACPTLALRLEARDRT